MSARIKLLEICWVTIPYESHFTNYNGIIGTLSRNQCNVCSSLLIPFKEALPATQPKCIAVAVIKAWHVYSHAPPHYVATL